MDKNSATTAMGNRNSWNTFDCVRKQEALCDAPKRKRGVEDGATDTPTPKKGTVVITEYVIIDCY